MIYWMTNPDHGTMPVYDLSEKERTEKLGWSLLNYGPSPDYASKAEKECKAALAESIRLDPPPAGKHTIEAPPGEGPATPMTASVQVFNVTDQASIKAKRKYTRKAK